MNESETLKKRLEQVIFERDHANACNDRLNAVLLGIVQLLHPPQLRAEDGRIFRFEAENPNALLQLLADKIRAILTANDVKRPAPAEPISRDFLEIMREYDSELVAKYQAEADHAIQTR